jgi:hypothetical protein
MDIEDEEDHLREMKRKELDRLSLELLSNTTHYKKYLAKTDPDAKNRTLQEMRRFSKHKSKVAELFLELLDDYEDLGTTSIVANTNIQRIFKECVEKTMQFIEWRDCMEPGDDETLFEHMEEEGDAEEVEPKIESSSFWGKPVNKSGYAFANQKHMFRRSTYK